MESGERGGAGTGTGTGVRLDSREGLGARETEGTDTGVVTVGTGSVGAWSAVSHVLLLERLLKIKCQLMQTSMKAMQLT